MWSTIMPELSTTTINQLISIFNTAGADASIVVPVKSRDLAELEILMHNRLLILEQDNDEHWYAALTPAGRQFVMSYVGLEESDVQHLRPRQTLKLAFDLTNALHKATLEQLQALDAQSVVDTLCHLIMMHQQLLDGDVTQFLENYPAATETIRAQLAHEMQSQAQNPDSAQIARLFEEIETVKSLLRHATPTERPSTRPTPEENLRGLEKIQSIAPTNGIGLRQIQAPVVSVPQYDEEESSELFVVQVDTDAGRRAAENFLKSLSSLQRNVTTSSED